MSTIQELEADLQDVSLLAKHATRPNSKELLAKEERRLKLRIAELSTKETATTSAAPAPSVSVASTVPLPTVKITNYGWDQSEKYVKIYVTFNGVHKAPAETIQSNFTDRSFSVHIKNFEGKNHVIEMVGLQHPIVAKDSLVKLKSDMILVMLRKEKDGKQWDEITRIAAEAKNKNLPKFDKEDSADPNESIMNMMKQLYETGDDEMKRTIRKAWYEGQQKKTDGGNPLENMDL